MRQLFLSIIGFFGRLVTGEIRKARQRKKRNEARKKKLKAAKKRAAEEKAAQEEITKRTVVVTITNEKVVSDEELAEISKPRALDPNPYDE